MKGYLNNYLKVTFNGCHLATVYRLPSGAQYEPTERKIAGIQMHRPHLTSSEVNTLKSKQTLGTTEFDLPIQTSKVRGGRRVRQTDTSRRFLGAPIEFLLVVPTKALNLSREIKIKSSHDDL